jgi:hypothetical protein
MFDGWIMAEELDIEFVRWSLDARKGIQSAILNLVTCHSAPNSLAAGQHALRFSALTGVAFSLWRAAFLASMETRPRLDERLPGSDKKSKAQTDHAADLLRTILASNAVGFGDDRRTESWMGQYYIDNAGFRVAHYLDHWGPEVVPAHIQRFNEYWAEQVVPTDYAASALAWMVIYAPFVSLIADLMKSMNKPLVTEMDMLETGAYRFKPRPVRLDNITLDSTATVGPKK